ncbi:MAG TPA: nucleotidyl transferase AbiEii/AbiGii toxin family protein [Phycisphaerae bacterium]
MDDPAAMPSVFDAVLLRPLEDAVGLFSALSIPYALIGGIAAMLYGRARFTEDVDFVAAAGHQEILAAHQDTMRQFHFDPVATWKLYHNSGIEVDVWKDEFSDQIAARARIVTFRHLQVRVAEVHDLIAMKLRAGRIQDDYDISEIFKHIPLDEPRLQQLVTPEQFAHFLSVKARTRA